MRRFDSVTRRSALALLTVGFAASGRIVSAQAVAMVVHKDPNCGCCAKWVQHLNAAGFAVTIEETSNLAAVRARLGVPSDLAACHTAEIDGYVIEGHVPAAAVRRLLESRPAAIGLAVPGMPAGSPGMEGGTPRKYDVMLFNKEGRQSFMGFLGTEITT